MNIIIVGAGKVGYIMARELRREDHGIVVIDRSNEVTEKLQNELDIATVVGNGCLIDILKEAGAETADLVIATTPSDEENIICCATAKKLGCKHAVARVRSPEYDRQLDFFSKSFGISLILNPEKTAAREISRLLHIPSFLKREQFSDGRISLVEFKLPEKSPLDGQPLEKMQSLVRVQALICTVERNGEITIPTGKFILRAGDKLTVTADTTALVKLVDFMGLANNRIKDVMIIGGGRLAVYLADLLIASHVNVKIVEIDHARCEVLADRLPKATVICGNGTNQKLLVEEGIARVDAVVTVTGIDEENLIVSMFACSKKVQKTVTKISHIEYSDLLAGIGIDTIVSPKVLTADEIVRYARAIAASGTGSLHKAEQYGTLETLYRIVDGKAEALGFTVPIDSKCVGKKLSELVFKPSVLVAGIIHQGQVIIPNGSDTMYPGDSVVVITSGSTISSFSEIFA